MGPDISQHRSLGWEECADKALGGVLGWGGVKAGRTEVRVGRPWEAGLGPAACSGSKPCGRQLEVSLVTAWICGTENNGKNLSRPIGVATALQ